MRVLFYIDINKLQKFLHSLTVRRYDVVGVVLHCFSQERHKIVVYVSILHTTSQPMHYTGCCSQLIYITIYSIPIFFYLSLNGCGYV